MDETTTAERPADGGLLKRAVEILESLDGWIGGRELAARLGLENQRDLRRMVICPLRVRKRVPVHAKPGPAGGYKLRVTAEEHAQCMGWNDQMGRDFLAIKAVLKSESLDLVMGQLVMEFLPHVRGQATAPRRDDMLGQLIDEESRQGRRVSWIDVLDGLLRVMTARPEEYAEPIEAIRQRYGGFFLPADQAAAIRSHLDEAQRLLQGAAKS